MTALTKEKNESITAFKVSVQKAVTDDVPVRFTDDVIKYHALGLVGKTKQNASTLTMEITRDQICTSSFLKTQNAA